VPHFGYIDAVRGWAVLGVILVHVSAHLPNLFPVLRQLNERGAMGVQLFFVASAFTLFLSHEARWLKDRRPLCAFFVRRIARIVPAFWLGAVFYLWWYGTGPRSYAPQGISTADVVATLFFVHGWQPEQINAVVPGGWSIAVEMNFYLLAPVLFALGRTVRGAIAIFWATWLVSVAASYTRLHDHLFPGASVFTQGNFAYFWLPAQLPVFALGLLTFHLVRCPPARAGILLHLVPLLVLAGLRLAPSQVFCGIAFALLILALSQNQAVVFVNRLSRLMGQVSFSAYLLHFAVLDVLREAFGMALPPASGWYNRSLAAQWIPEPILSLSNYPDYVQFLVLFVSCVAGTFLVSTITYHLIEKPGIRAGQWLIRRLGLSHDGNARHVLEARGSIREDRALAPVPVVGMASS